GEAQQLVLPPHEAEVGERVRLRLRRGRYQPVGLAHRGEAVQLDLAGWFVEEAVPRGLVRLGAHPDLVGPRRLLQARREVHGAAHDGVVADLPGAYGPGDHDAGVDAGAARQRAAARPAGLP